MEKKAFQKIILENQKGFSLLEILIALTLLALAGTFVAGKFMEKLAEGQVNSTKIQMSNIESNLKEFRRKCGFYPSSEQGLDSLVNKPTSGRECKDYPASGFIEGESIPKDPWDMDFIYESDGKTFNIYSYGNDKEPGGEGADADIYLRAAKGAATPGGEAAGGEGSNEEAPQE